MAFADLAGRALLSLIFIGAGLNKIFSFSATAEHMAAHQMPWPYLLLPATILLEAGAGLALLLGWHARIAAASLAAFLVPATVIFHTNLVVAHSTDESIALMKNLAILGGLILAAAHGPGGWSLDARRSPLR